MRILIAALKMTLFALLCLAVVPLQMLVLAFHTGKGAYFFPCMWQRLVCSIFGIKVIVRGEPYTQSQTIYVANHLSYLDIPAIGSVLKASFVAKQEVESWPVFGFLSKLQQTAFISRSKSDAQKEKNALGTMLEQGKSLIIFPEGTSTDGRDVMPFKSSLFSLVLQDSLDPLRVQAVTVQMQEVDKRPVLSQNDRDIYSWHLNMDTEMPVHLWGFAKSRGARISLTFHAPRRADDFTDRKILAKTCYDDVREGLDVKPPAEDDVALNSTRLQAGEKYVRL